MNVNVWWANYRDTTLRLLTFIGTYASLLGVVLTLQPQVWSGWTLGLVVLSLVFLAAVVVLELRGRRHQSAYAKEDAAAIQGYMQRWISKSGRAAIWSRDLTWATSPRVKQLLLQKAHDGELVLCVPSATDLTAELAQAGAEVCVYAVGNYAPASRFTIIDFGKQGARVAVGRSQGEFHVIDEFDATTHPAFYLAQDLVDLVRARHRSQASQA